MKTFTDTQGRSWSIAINFTSLCRVKDLTGVDLIKFVDVRSETFSEVVDDAYLLFDVLCAVVKPQMQQTGISIEEFGTALDETALESAVKTLIEGVIDFFRDEKRLILRKAFNKVMNAAEQRQTSVMDRARMEIDSPQFDQAIETALNSMSGS